MSLVVDASVAAKWFVEEPLWEETEALFRHRDSLLAPKFLIAEVTNVAWKKVAHGEINHVRLVRLPKKLVGAFPDFIHWRI